MPFAVSAALRSRRTVVGPAGPVSPQPYTRSPDKTNSKTGARDFIGRGVYPIYSLKANGRRLGSVAGADPTGAPRPTCAKLA